jgi:lipopolysaccharide/colanic/teichoic acid biosynthesis glycosyltransferase
MYQPVNYPTSSAPQVNRRLNCIIKRAFDIFVSFFALVILAPVFGLISLAIKRDSPGPVIYRGPRLGLRGRVFYILKFRTMYEEPRSYSGPKVTSHDDPRVTPLGRWLRETKLNELPQLWNVIKGEMSLVGPRPEDPSLAKTWPRNIREEILSVRPGITSPASVQYHNEELLLSNKNILKKYILELSPDKMRLDQLYVRYCSFWLDLDTLLWTLLIFLPRIRSYSPPEELLFVGPMTRFIHRYVSWFLIDFLTTFTIISLIGVIWRVFGPLDVGWLRALLMALGFALIFSLTGALIGVNQISWSLAKAVDVIFYLLPSWLIATSITLFIHKQARILPSGIILTGSAFIFVSFVVTRYRSRLITGILARILGGHGRSKTARERILIIGSDLVAQYLAWLLEHPANAGKYWAVGYIDNDLFKQGMRINGLRVIGTHRDIPQLVEKKDIGLIVIADQQMISNDCQLIFDTCERFSARLIVMPDIIAAINGIMEAPLNDKNIIRSDQSDGEYLCQHCLASNFKKNDVQQSNVFDV